MKKLFALTALFTLLASAAFAMSLDEGRAKGLVGERLDGYLGTVSSNADAQALADDINAKRKAAYKKVAAKNGQPISVVEKLAAKKLIEKVKSGQYYMDASGNWKKK